MALKGVKLTAQQVYAKYKPLLAKVGIEDLWLESKAEGAGSEMAKWTPFSPTASEMFWLGYYIAWAEPAGPLLYNTWNPNITLPAGARARKYCATFHLNGLYGCCGVCIAHNVSVTLAHQNKGVGAILNNLRVDMARNMGYGLLICTDKDSNKHNRSILGKNGWKDVHQYTNPRTTNKVNLSVMDL